ncbi:group protein B3 [Seminavis robusta]|uniref:Group protein B3 n=1 Tax=Seminavis robusta TaxID=568900 RepID=A0A9N8E4T4_9STRA|nr:group protein B3 [Seminavis robusta]|eukprot:Sro620_g176590.1 group protein B3 (76) ;mRNA; r:22200-22590
MAKKADGDYKPKKAKKAGKGGKKPLSGFMLFSRENRPQVKEENPEITFGQMGKKLGEMWRALTDEEREEFKKRKE